MAWVAINTDRGFGLTDESFYWWFTAHPGAFRATIQPFGPPLHLLYQFVDRSLIEMRLAGMLMLVISGGTLGFSLIRYLDYTRLNAARWNVVVITAMIMLTNYSLWLITPNYNLMANVSAALILAGLLELFRPGRAFILHSVLVGLGGTLAFFAKPTFAALAAMTAAWVFAHGAKTDGWRAAALRACVTTLTCCFSLFIILQSTVGVDAFFSSVILGIQNLNFGNSLATLPAKTAGELFQAPEPVILGVGILALTAVGHRMQKFGSARRRLFDILFLGAVLYSATVVAFSLRAEAAPMFRIGPLALLVACGAVGIIFGGRVGPKDAEPRLGLPLILLLLPFALSFGTTNPIYMQTSLYVWPWVLLAALAAWIKRPAIAPQVETAIAVGVLGLLAWASWLPYGLSTSIWKQTVAVRVPFSTDTIRMDIESARYVKQLRQEGVRGRITRGTPVIDLSNGGPGTAMFLGGRPPIFPWLVPIYGTSEETANAVWALISLEQQKTAWFIGPVHPNLAKSLAARHLADPGSYVLKARMIGSFGSHQPIEIWRPATAGDRPDTEAQK